VTATTPKPDTGHPFGLLRCLVHDDGHVAMLANDANLVPRVEAMGALLDEIGLQGWRLEWRALEDAAERYVHGLACRLCAIRVSCGCDVVADVLAGRCRTGLLRPSMRRPGGADTWMRREDGREHLAAHQP
jgi:hypothetical protein